VTRQLLQWSDLTIADVAAAYHKAKCDAFFERSVVACRAFAGYEEILETRLQALLQKLHEGKAASILSFFGNKYDVVPKKVNWTLQEQGSRGTEAAAWFATDGPRRFKRRIKDHAPSIELRICARFTVEAHIVGALWINLIGHRLDGALGPDCYGSRVRRIHSPLGSSDGPRAQRPYHLRARGSFEPYIHPYLRWRNDAMARTRTALAAGDRVLVLMADLKGYYHSVDPRFVCSKGFTDFISLKLDMPLNKFETEFTASIAESFVAWGRRASAELLGAEQTHWGLPIGSAVARILANLLLIQWDHAVSCGLSPIHYGRYVDDMIFVLRDHECIDDEQKLLDFMRLRLALPAHGSKPVLSTNDGEWHIDLGKEYAGDTKLILQKKKLRMFCLEGQSGIDFLDTLDREARLVSSERRLLPEPDMLEQTTAARVLTATEHPGDDADTFRRAGGLSLRRFAWSVNLRNAEVLARDLPPAEWTAERHQFYRFAHDHLLCPDKFLDHIDAFTRLIGLAIACGDSHEAAGMIAKGRESLDSLGTALEVWAADPAVDPLWAPLRLNGACDTRTRPVTTGKTWQSLQSFLMRTAEQAVLRAWSAGTHRWTATGSTPLMTEYGEIADALYLEGIPPTDAAGADVERLARSILAADLGRLPVESFLVPDIEQPPAILEATAPTDRRCTEQFLRDCFPADDQYGWVEAFVHATGSTGLPVEGSREGDLTPFFFPTRPVPAPKIARLVPECVAVSPTWCREPEQSKLSEPFASYAPVALWAGLVRALRGVACTVPIGAAVPRTDGVVVLGGQANPDGHLLALANMHLEESWWSASAAGNPETGKARLARFARLINSAIQARPRPYYLVLPELSLPRRWVDGTATLLRESGIDLIAGVEYGHGPRHLASGPPLGGSVVNQAVMCLVDRRLGFPYPVQLWQTKTHPAPREEQELHVKHGRSWNGGAGMASHPRDRKPVYVHNDLNFGILICSELQNLNYRIGFQGEVDLLLVLSWNQDLNTFDALTESAGFDIHAYVGVVNNGSIGDTRLRVPAKEPYRRDICRIRGGINDYVVVARLDAESLRKFHSRALNWPTSYDAYKPVPEGFLCAPRRRRVP